MRAVLERNGDGETPVWITEMGWATSGVASRFTVDPATQAAYLRRAFRKLTERRQELRLAGLIWYSLRDSLAGAEWLHRSGLLEESGQAKPAWTEFVRFTGGSP